jgi:hypothetical protein
MACIALACCLTFSIATPQVHASPVHTPVTSTSPHVVTPATNRVDCDGRTDFLRIWSGQYVDCFANAGELTNLGIVHVFQICMGNNYGYILFGNPSGIIWMNDWNCIGVPVTSAGLTSTTVQEIIIQGS